jgi:hypothetical protein
LRGFGIFRNDAGINPLPGDNATFPDGSPAKFALLFSIDRAICRKILLEINPGLNE